MAYLGKMKKVQTSVRAVVMYLEKESRSEASIFTAGLNASADPSVFMSTIRGLQEHHGVPSDRLPGRTTVVSFTAEEVDPEDEEACARAFEVVRRTAARAVGDRGFPVLLHGQRDGDSRLFHVHKLMPNVNVDDGRAMRGDDYTWERWAVILAEEMQAAGIEHSHEAMRERVKAIQERQPHRYERSGRTSEDVQARKRGDVALPDRIVEALGEVFPDRSGQSGALAMVARSKEPADLEELNERLAGRGLSVEQRSGKLVYVELVDEETEGGTVRRQGRRARQKRVEDARGLQEADAVPVTAEEVAQRLQEAAAARENVQRNRDRPKGGGPATEREKAAQRQREAKQREFEAGIEAVGHGGQDEQQRDQPKG